MINSLGGIRQLAMVVKDAEQTMRYFSQTLGVGPFFVVRNYVPDDYRYRGQSAPAPELTLCFAQAGPVQVEIIQQHNQAASGYTEFLGAGREGCQHVALWFDDTAAYTAARQRILEAGLVLVHENGERAAYSRFAYFETALPGGLMLEIAEALTPNVRAMFEQVASAAVGWDGADPIRSFG
jgi:catechol 2,3-dioxygenase-like lactoylglutathione lyase family enzyme